MVYFAPSEIADSGGVFTSSRQNINERDNDVDDVHRKVKPIKFSHRITSSHEEVTNRLPFNDTAEIIKLVNCTVNN